MNNARRARLRTAVSQLTDVESIVQSVCDQEEDAMDNCPENLQNGDRFDCMELAVDSLNDALEKLDEAKDCIQTAIAQ